MKAAYDNRWDTIMETDIKSHFDKARQCIENASESFAKIPVNSFGHYRSDKMASEAYGTLHKALVFAFEGWNRYVGAKRKKRLPKPKFISDYIDIIKDSFPANIRKEQTERVYAIYQAIHVMGYYEGDTSPEHAAQNLKSISDLISDMEGWMI